jgi:hypothetical protein
MANRHGLVSGATGTGKTITLRVLAEQFSRIGVPIFLADVKGDLSGMAYPGGDNERVAERAAACDLQDFRYEGVPVVFWDVFCEQGHPVRATVSDMGPLLLSRILGLTETQSDVLTMIFRIADDAGLLLLDLEDLRAMVRYVAENSVVYRTKYGNISPATAGAIQRSILNLEGEGGDRFFGEPMLDIMEFFQVRGDRGVVNILAASHLLNSPRLYATFLLYLLSEIFERLPEVGDPEKPRFIFFFDEAHLLFTDSPKVLLDKIVQVVRLVRSKGVGVWFVTQNPLDLPEEVLGQLSNRVQHALRAFTPRDQKAVKAAAETMRQNPAFDTATAITELSIGEALVSFLDVNGSPTITERALIYPPQSRLSPLTQAEITEIIQKSPIYGKYETMINRRSASEMLENLEKTGGKVPIVTKKVDTAVGPKKVDTMVSPKKVDTVVRVPSEAPHQKPELKSQSSGGQDLFVSTAKDVVSTVGKELVRGILGGLKRI